MMREEQHASTYMLSLPEPSRKTKQLVCQYCGKTFPSMAALAGHIRGHKQASRADSQAALLEALSRQAAALEAIARELAAIRHLLSGLNVIEAKVEKRVITSAPPAVQQPGQKPGKLPSFLANNPWLEILGRRGKEPEP
jgi:hypothetical protein